MTETIREQIIQNVVTKIGRIRTANGYNTEAGKIVKRAELIPIDGDLLPASSVFPLPELSLERYSGRTLRQMEVRVQAISQLKGLNPSVVSELLLGDLIEAVFGTSWTLNFDSGGTYHPQAGHEIEGESDGATAIIESVVVDSGAFDDGDADGSLVLRRLVGAFGDDETLKINGNVNSATVDGSITGQDPKDSTTGGLADSIDYVSGGNEVYPETVKVDDVVGAEIVLNIGYKTQTGDPYTQ